MMFSLLLAVCFNLISFILASSFESRAAPITIVLDGLNSNILLPAGLWKTKAEDQAIYARYFRIFNPELQTLKALENRQIKVEDIVCGHENFEIKVEHYLIYFPYDWFLRGHKTLSIRYGTHLINPFECSCEKVRAKESEENSDSDGETRKSQTNNIGEYEKEKDHSDHERKVDIEFAKTLMVPYELSEINTAKSRKDCSLLKAFRRLLKL